MDDTKNPTENELHGRRLSVTAKLTAKTNGVSPPPVGYPPASGSMGFSPMPTRYDLPPVPASQVYHIQEAERLRREAEKKRIKGEIIAAGVAWRRDLEAEVLRDLLMEGFDFPGSELLQVPESDEEKLIALAKLDPGHCGVKRKVENLLEVPSLPCPGVKKPREEFLSCSLCHESSTDENDLKSHLQGTKHQAKVAALRAELAAKCCGTPPAANKPPANTSKLSFISPGSELNGTPLVAEVAANGCSHTLAANNPANLSKLSASAFGPDAKVEVGEEVGSKTDDLASQYCKSLQWEKKFKNWCEMWKVGAYAPSVMYDHLNVAHQHSQSEEIVADIPIRRLPADDEKEDDISIKKAGGSMHQDRETERVHDVLENRDVEFAAPKPIIAEVFSKAHSKAVEELYADLAQLPLNSNGKNDDIAIKKADGSMVCDARTEAVQDDQENETVEGAALNAIAADMRREKFRKLFKKRDQN